MDGAVIAVIGTVAGALASSAAALGGAWVNGRNQRMQRREEHRAQQATRLEEEKKSAYVAYLQSFHELHYHLNVANKKYQPGTGWEEIDDGIVPLVTDLRRRLAVVRLTGSESVREAADAARRILHSYYLQVLVDHGHSRMDVQGDPEQLRTASNEAAKRVEQEMRAELSGQAR